MFSLEQKHLADAQVAYLVATIRHHQGKRGPELAEMLGMDYDEYRELVWSNQPGEGKIERLEEMTRAVRGRYMIPTPSALTHLIDAGLITLHTAIRQVHTDRPPFEVVLAISCLDGPPIRCGSSTRPHEHRALLAHANAAVAAASAHAQLRVAAELEKRRGGGLGSGSVGPN